MKTDTFICHCAAQKPSGMMKRCGMTSFMARLSLVTLILQCQAVDPGIRVLLTKSGVDEVLKTWRRMFVQRMVYWDPVKLRIYGLRDYVVINNVRAARMNHNVEIRAAVERAVGLRFSVQRLSIEYHGSLSSYSTQEPSVPMHATIPNLSFETVVRLENVNGILQPKMESCEATVLEAVSLHFDGPVPKAVKALRLFNPIVLKGFVERSLCKHIATAIFPPIRHILNLPAKKFKLAENYYLDYSMMEQPLISRDSMETAYNGEVYIDRGFKHSPTSAVQAPPLSSDLRSPLHSSAMVLIFMSNYTLNTLLYSLYRAGKFNMAVNHKTSPDSFVNYLKTGCQESQICAGTIFPSLGDKYPNSTLDMQIKLLKSPTAVFKSNAIEITTLSTIKGSVRSERNRQYHFFSGQMSLVTSVKRLRLHHYFADGDISFEQLELEHVKSNVAGIDKTTMSFVVSYALDLLVKPDIQKKLKNSMKIPKANALEMFNGVVTVQPDRVVIGFQLCQEAKCDRSAVGNARSADQKTQSVTYDAY